MKVGITISDFDEAYKVTKASDLLKEISELYHQVVVEGNRIYEKWEADINRTEFNESARNLSYYLALRQRDIRGIQRDLVPWGLSSLGRLESKTLSTLEAVIHALTAIVGKQTNDKAASQTPPFDAFNLGEERLASNTAAILGEKPDNRNTRIMVTMPTEAAHDGQLVRDLIAKGMNVARINCAHDTQEIWSQIISNIRQNSSELKKDVRILMDIAGPKIRTDWIFTTHKKPKVTVGDFIYLTKDYDHLPKHHDAKVTAGCSIPQIFEQMSLDDPVLIDDGSVETTVIEVNKNYAKLEVRRIKGKSIRIKAEKGLNFPGVYFTIDILTQEDKEAIAFTVKHADILGCSFVRDVKDIKAIQTELISLLGQEAKNMAMMVKIETVKAVQNLTQIILSAASENPFSVMIARGDLAVETGYIRLAEVQQQIMWICEAADIPVVWGTEVLANMIETGIPSRAEVTDAAEGVRSECVMLNKGDYIVEAVEMLDEILDMMEEHQFKKTPKLRALSIAKIND